MININEFLASSLTNPGHRNFSYDINDFFLQQMRAFQDPAGYPRILDIIDLRPLLRLARL
jgi:hypothetical protein